MILRTSKPIDECVGLLEKAMDVRAPGLRGITAQMAAKKDVMGVIQGSNICLEKHRSYRNSLAPVFYGSITSDQETGGTTITGDFGMDHSARRAFIGLPILLVVAVVFTIWKNGSAYGLFRDSFTLICMLGIALGFVCGKLLARGERRYLIGFLVDTLQTTIVTSR